MRTPSTDIFGLVEDNNDENIEGEEEEDDDDDDEEPEEEEENEDDTSSSEEEGEADDDDEPDPWSPLRQKVGKDLKETYLKEVQQFLDKGKSQHYAENAAFNALLPVSKRRLRSTYLERLKWTHRIKHDVIHRKVMKTLRRFIEEDEMDEAAFDMAFDEAAESAVAKRKFLINRGRKKKSLPEESDDNKDEENDILVTKT